MFFNSIDFAIFLPVVFILYWLVSNKNLRLQNLFIVAASYFFYACWDWRFLSLIIFSTVVDFLVGRRLQNENSTSRRKWLLCLSIAVNLGLLGFFKYFDFFLENFVATFSFLGMDINAQSLNIILPVGISFYTFQTLSYTIDVYRKKLDATDDFIAFAAFVSFFPQLVAGPIERATNLLPQFQQERKADQEQMADGMRQILWGFFKKIVIADNCAVYANMIFDGYDTYSGSTLLLGAFFFAFQIYGDFSGYSDIAIGTARLFGFRLMQNFAFPYFSRDIAEFWRRWHISLSTWFRDYLYIPLGGSRVGKWLNIRNVFIIFIVSGFWHGANWTFIAWGALNALYFLPLLLLNQNRNHLEIVAKGKYFPSIKELLQILFTFGLTLLAWIFFRAESIHIAFHYIYKLFIVNLFSIPEVTDFSLFLLLLAFIIIEWLGREQQYAIQNIANISTLLLRYAVYYILIMIIIFFSSDSEEAFIYFQF